MSSAYKRRLKKAKSEVTIDNLTYLALISPVMTLPQLYLVFTTDAKGVSLPTWITFLCVATLWLLYGLRHKIKPLIIVHSSWIVIDSAIVIGLLAKR